MRAHVSNRQCPNNPGELWSINYRKDGTPQCDLCGEVIEETKPGTEFIYDPQV